jgi:Rieske Fe-S protein
MTRRADSPLPPERRQLLAGLGGLAGLALLGCAPAAPPGPPPARVALADLEPGTRLRVVHRGGPAEVRRDADGTLRARSLRCTHMGCEVRWREAEGYYQCPCHEGRFAADGRPIAGPPPRPLRELAVSVEGAVVVVEDVT